MRRKYPSKDVKILYGRAAGRCSFFSICFSNPVEMEEDQPDANAKQNANIAHIVAHGLQGPRADPNYPTTKLDTYENWILLCRNCHGKVDQYPEKYTVEKLRTAKKEHEQWCSEQLNIKGGARVSFEELDEIVLVLLSDTYDDVYSLSVIPIEEKLEKNSLSKKTQKLLAKGLCDAGIISSFLVEKSKCDPYFLEKLSCKFRYEYLTLKQQASGDELFELLLYSLKKDYSDFKKSIAILSLLSYLFHICEVFEK